MRDRCPFCATLALLAVVTTLAVRADAATLPVELPSRSAVVAVMNLVADRARRTYPSGVDAFWDDGVYQTGIMALYGVTRDPALLAYTEDFGRYNGWSLDRGGNANLHNRLAAAQSWIAASDASPVADLSDVRAEVAAQRWTT